MKRIWFLVLALSLGLNAGMLYVSLSHQGGKMGTERDKPGRDDKGNPGESERERQPERAPGDFEAVIRSHLDRMTRDLHLDGRQRSAIAAVHERLLPRINEQRREMDSIRVDVASQYARPTVEPLEFHRIVRRLSSAQARLDSLVTEAMLGEAAVLTFDQRQAYLREMPWGNPMPPRKQSVDQRQERPPDEERDRPRDNPPDRGRDQRWDNPPDKERDRPPREEPRAQ
jgi:hypothetical protein